MLAQRRARPDRRPHLGAARGRGRRRPAHRRRDHRVPLPHGRRRQRDHHQAARQRLVLGLAQPRRAGQALRRPGAASPPGSRRRCASTPRARCWPASPPRTSSCTAPSIPAGERVLLVVGSANRDERVFDRRRRATTSTAPSSELQQIASFGFGRHFCLGASLARLEARVCLEELVRPGRPTTRSTTTGIRRVHSVNVRGFAALPTTVVAALMPQVRRRTRSAGRPSSPARRRASARRRPRPLAAAGHPGRARRAPARPAARRRRPRSAAAGGEAVALPLDLTDDASIDAFADGAEARARPDRGRGLQRRRRAARPPPLEVDPDDFARQVEVNLLGAHRLVRRLGPGMVERRRGDIVFVTSDVVRRAAHRTWPPTSRPSAASRAWPAPCRWSSRAPACASSIVRPGPVDHRAGHRPGTRTTVDEVIADWERWGLVRHPASCAAEDVADAIAHRRVHAPRHPPHPGRGRARGPVGRNRMTDVDTELASRRAPPVRATRRAPATSRSCASTRSG